MKSTLTTAALLAAVTSSMALAQSTVVVPAGYATTVENSTNSFPFYGTTSWPGLRLLQIYDSSNFTLQSINFPILIQGVRFRVYDTTGSWTGRTYNNTTIQMSTAAVDYTLPDTNWANNHGGDLATVYSGPVVINAGTGNGIGVPGPFMGDTSFTTAFLYDPSSGNDLVLDVDHDMNYTGGTNYGHAVVSGTAGLGGPALGSRVFGSSLYPAANGFTNDHSIVVEFDYIPANGLYASFTSDVTTGPSPLTVNFQDTSFSSDPGGVTGWAWDFENDGTVDSTAQNPTHTYTACGTYDVSLTATDGAFPPSTVVRTAYITTDLSAADFSSTVIGPLTVQFNDLSTGNPTSWSWDLDGDGTADSTAQNPAWVYPSATAYNVSLTVQRLCGPSDTMTQSIVPLQQISTGLASNNGNGNYGSVMFDLDVTNPTGITIGALDVFTSTVSLPVQLDMYVRQGTYTGFHANPEEWVLVGSATGTSSTGSTVPSSLTFNNRVYLPPGVHGVKFHYMNFYCSYTTGTAVQSFGNGDVMMIAGTSQYTTQLDPFAGTTITPRWFAGTIYYDTHNITGNAEFGEYGPGCPSSAGLSSLTASARPIIGTTIQITANNLPAPNIAIMMTGFSNSSSLLGPLPFDGTPYGAAGCWLRVSPDANLLLLGAGGTAVHNFAVPNA
ncbi:MAG: PKD domain-containing protein, partial [Planctomycetes bacterium]|nr:PKD domain-containing protein [Planctomycetota bacterium]